MLNIYGRSLERFMTKKKINSKRKGKVGELDLAHYLTGHGFEAKRGQQFKGTEDSPDVECERLNNLGWHIECKRTERFKLYEALEQAQKDSGNQKPMVWHRRNNKDWVVVLDGKDFLQFAKDFEQIWNDFRKG